MSQHNAKMVVAAWRERGLMQGRQAFSEPALSMEPSRINETTARVWAEIAKMIDAKADELAALGFHPGHPLMCRLRGMASSAAHENQAAVEWASELFLAESEPEENKQ